jgi:hypothetical protein
MKIGFRIVEIIIIVIVLENMELKNVQENEHRKNNKIRSD